MHPYPKPTQPKLTHSANTHLKQSFPHPKPIPSPNQPPTVQSPTHQFIHLYPKCIQSANPPPKPGHPPTQRPVPHPSTPTHFIHPPKPNSLSHTQSLTSSTWDALELQPPEHLHSAPSPCGGSTACDEGCLSSLCHPSSLLPGGTSVTTHITCLVQCTSLVCPNTHCLSVTMHITCLSQHTSLVSSQHVTLVCHSTQYLSITTHITCLVTTCNTCLSQYLFITTHISWQIKLSRSTSNRNQFVSHWFPPHPPPPPPKKKEEKIW